MSSNKENMKIAMKELLNKVGIGEEPEDETRQFKNQDEVADAENIGREVTDIMNAQQHHHDVNHEQKIKFADGMIRKSEVAEQTMGVPSVSPYRAPVQAQKTIISAGTTMTGDMRAEGDIVISGKIKGNLETTGNVWVDGKVLGNIKGNTVELSACTIKGNITATDTILINGETIVVGDIFANTLTTDGKIKGNVQAEKTVSFQQNSVLLGNVTALLVNMNEGARVQGTIYISEDGDTSALFNEDLDF